MASAERSAEARLPSLREDLKLISPQPGDAVLRLLIYDPARHSYFEIDQATFEVLSWWREGMTPRALSSAVAASFGHNVDHRHYRTRRLRHGETIFLPIRRMVIGVSSSRRRAPHGRGG